MNAKIQEAINNVSERAPMAAAIVMIVAIGSWMHYETSKSFRDYLTESEARSQQVSSLRIETCHQVQRDSVQATSELTKTLKNQEQAFIRLLAEIEDLTAEIKRR